MNLLLLGGTSEARELAGTLAARDGVATTLSLAGVTRKPLEMPVPVRIGGFGGVDGLVHYIREHGIDHVIDATHPFAGQMSRNAAQACRAAGCELWRLGRPAWQARAGDDWHSARDLDDAAGQLTRFGERVFLSVGARSLAPFESVAGKHWIVRSIEPPQPPPAFTDWTPILDRPPFGKADEIALLRAHAVDVIVTKNSGAAATTAKLDAARELGLPVVMVERPDLPAGDRHFTGVESLLDAFGHDGRG